MASVWWSIPSRRAKHGHSDAPSRALAFANTSLDGCHYAIVPGSSRRHGSQLRGHGGRSSAPSNHQLDRFRRCRLARSSSRRGHRAGDAISERGPEMSRFCAMGTCRCPDADGAPHAARLAPGWLQPVRTESGLRWRRRDLAGPRGGVAVHLQRLGAIPPLLFPVLTFALTGLVVYLVGQAPILGSPSTASGPAF